MQLFLFHHSAFGSMRFAIRARSEAGARELLTRYLRTLEKVTLTGADFACRIAGRVSEHVYTIPN